jgi:hypothetical protein
VYPLYAVEIKKSLKRNQAQDFGGAGRFGPFMYLNGDAMSDQQGFLQSPSFLLTLYLGITKCLANKALLCCALI